MDALDLADEHDVVAMTEDARIGMKKPHRTMFMKNWRCSLTRCLRDLSAGTAAAAEETYFGSLQLSWSQFNVTSYTSVLEQAAEVASSAAAAASEAAANITSVVAEGASVAAAAASDATTSAYVGASAAVAAASEATASVYEINVSSLLSPEASAEPKVLI
jgi:hypothetical protein